MYSLNQVINGISKYLDNEILIKVTGWQKWVYGAGMGIVLNKSTNIFNELKNSPMIKTLELIDNEDNIDVDTIYINLKKEAEKGAITFNIKGLGALTLNSGDVDKLYNYIKEA